MLSFKIFPTTSCQVCYEDFKEAQVYKCGNDPCEFPMCKNCGKQHLQNSNSCPACRQEILHDTFLDLPPKERTPCCFKIVPRETPATISLDWAAKKCYDFASGACLCLTATACLTLIPKALGYYACSGCSCKTPCLKVFLGGSQDQCMGEWCAGMFSMTMMSTLCCGVCKCYRENRCEFG